MCSRSLLTVRRADPRTRELTDAERPADARSLRRTGLLGRGARRLVVRRLIDLPGFFTVDAISPDGRRLYLVQYPGENVLDYRVRVLDTRTGRLDARDVVDPRNPDEQMGGRR